MSKFCSEFLIQPNSAHHQRSWFWPFFVLVAVCLGISLRFAWLGYWMILPFALLDILVVGLVFRHIWKKSNYIERIRISQDGFEIRHIEPRKHKTWCFPLHWTQIRLQYAEHPWYPHRLLLGFKGEWVEVGQCLTNQERELLTQEVRSELARLQQSNAHAH